MTQLPPDIPGEQEPPTDLQLVLAATVVLLDDLADEEGLTEDQRLRAAALSRSLKRYQEAT